MSINNLAASDSSGKEESAGKLTGRYDVPRSLNEAQMIMLRIRALFDPVNLKDGYFRRHPEQLFWRERVVTHLAGHISTVAQMFENDPEYIFKYLDQLECIRALTEAMVNRQRISPLAARDYLIICTERYEMDVQDLTDPAFYAYPSSMNAIVDPEAILHLWEGVGNSHYALAKGLTYKYVAETNNQTFMIADNGEGFPDDYKPGVSTRKKGFESGSGKGMAYRVNYVLREPQGELFLGAKHTGENVYRWKEAATTLEVNASEPIMGDIKLFRALDNPPVLPADFQSAIDAFPTGTAMVMNLPITKPEIPLLPASS